MTFLTTLAEITAGGREITTSGITAAQEKVERRQVAYLLAGPGGEQ